VREEEKEKEEPSDCSRRIRVYESSYWSSKGHLLPSPHLSIFRVERRSHVAGRERTREGGVELVPAHAAHARPSSFLPLSFSRNLVGAEDVEDPQGRLSNLFNIAAGLCDE